MNFLKSLLSYIGLVVAGMGIVVAIYHLKEIRECSMWKADASLIEYQWQKDQCEALK